MRHLRLFEGYLDKYYQELTYDDMVSWFNQTEKSKLTQKMYLRIVNLFGPEWEKEPHNNTWSIDFRKPTDRGVWHVITGMLYDEWFYVVIRYSGRPVSNEWCFKCDQFEGLEKLLKVKEIIK